MEWRCMWLAPWNGDATWCWLRCVVAVVAAAGTSQARRAVGTKQKQERQERRREMSGSRVARPAGLGTAGLFGAPVAVHPFLPRGPSAAGPRLIAVRMGG